MQFRAGIELASLTDVGCQRQNNEDRYAYWEAASDEQFARKGRLAIVADGMGGYEGGQEASRIAVDTVERVYSDAPEAAPQDLLREGFAQAHARILEYAGEHRELRGMGTTCTAIALVGRNLYFAHVGDSRLYLLRNSAISRLTRDHSYVGRLVESGAVSAEAAESHPQRHILTAALGAGDQVVPEVPDQPVLLQEGDTLILCTDGLWGQMSEDEIKAAVDHADLSTACAALVKIAKDAGGPDNITVQILRLSS